MNFGSSAYAVLLGVVLVLYYSLRGLRARNTVLLAAGLFFYGSWDHRFLFLLIFSASVDYVGALAIRTRRPSTANAVLFLASALGASCVLCAPVSWDRVWSAVLPASAFAGGWVDQLPFRIFDPAGDWRILVFATLAWIVLGLTTFIGYRLREDLQPKYFLSISLTVNLLLLGVFKYFDFFVGSASEALASLGFGIHTQTLGLVVPAGISFYTFQAMSYTIDVYRGDLEPTSYFPDYLLFVSFFPHLVAGPIQQANWLLPQLRQDRRLRYGAVSSAAWLIGSGLCKKLFIADNLARVVAPVYADMSDLTGPRILVATYAFALQIYADFSAYTDIARGTSRLFGIELTPNFNVPYAAANPREFWSRWHISLSSWLRDYLYIPLGGSRRSGLATYRNLMITMGLGGLWHGARANFVLWGVYQGTLLCLHRTASPHLRRYSERLGVTRRVLSALGWIAFLHLVAYGWLLFRSESWSQLAELTGALTGGWHAWHGALPGLARVAWFAWPILLMDVLTERAGRPFDGQGWPLAARVCLYVVLFYLVVLFGSIDATPFIYFQF